MFINVNKVLTLTLFVSLLSACGGGDGGSDDIPSDDGFVPEFLDPSEVVITGENFSVEGAWAQCVGYGTMDYKIYDNGSYTFHKRAYDNDDCTGDYNDDQNLPITGRYEVMEAFEFQGKNAQVVHHFDLKLGGFPIEYEEHVVEYLIDGKLYFAFYGNSFDEALAAPVDFKEPPYVKTAHPITGEFINGQTIPLPSTETPPVASAETTPVSSSETTPKGSNAFIGRWGKCTKNLMTGIIFDNHHFTKFLDTYEYDECLGAVKDRVVYVDVNYQLGSEYTTSDGVIARAVALEGYDFTGARVWRIRGYSVIDNTLYETYDVVSQIVLSLNISDIGDLNYSRPMTAY